MEWAALHAKGSKAWAILEAKKTGTTVVASDETTATSVTVANPDGTLTTEMTSGPERVWRGGKWRKVDATLTKTADGGVKAKEHPEGLRLAGQGGTAPRSLATAQSATARDLVTLGTGDQAVTLQWKGGLPAPELDGSTARYREAVPGADVIVEATRTGFEQFVQIHDKPAGSYSYTLPVKAKGLKAKANKDGSVTFADAKTGQRRATMPAPVMWDNSVDKRSGEHTRRARVDMKVVDKGAGKVDLVVTPDADYLTDPDTQYPVTVDPSTSALSNTFDTYVQQGETVDWSTDVELDFGNPGTKNADGTPRTARSFITWNTTPIQDALIVDTNLALWNFHSGNTDCSTQSWTIWDTTAASTSSRWSAQPTWNQQYHSSTQTRGNPDCTGTQPDGWINADVDTLVQTWASAKATRGHMGLRAATDDTRAWKRVNSGNATTNQPKLTVTYNYRPSDGTARQAGAPFKSYAGVWAVNTTTPTLRDTFTDPDGDTVNGTFQVYDAATNTPITTPLGEGLLVSDFGQQGKPVSVVVPAGQLKDGKTYKFRTNAYDGTHYNLNWSPWTQFVVDTTPPGAPAKIASTDYPENVWTPNKGAGNFGITPPAGDDVRGIESRTNGDAWTAEKPAVAGEPTTVTGMPDERGMNRIEGRAVDRADNKGSETVYDYGTGKEPISGNTAIPDGGANEDPIPEEEPYEAEDVPEKQPSPHGAPAEPGSRDNCYTTDNPEIEMCQSRQYDAEITRAARALPAPTDPLVSWCSDPSIGAYTLTRQEGCHKVGVVADWWQISNNQPPKHIGTAIFLVREEMKLDNKGEWHQRNFIAPLNIQSSLGTVSLDYWDATCGGDTICNKEFVGPEFTGPTSWTSASSVTEQTVQTRKFTWKTAAVGASQEFDRGSFLGFKVSAAPGSVEVTEPSWVFWEQIRCDQMMPNAASVCGVRRLRLPQVHADVQPEAQVCRRCRAVLHGDARQARLAPWQQGTQQSPAP
ncbi:DNRLRE domain-containing protein [Streptomyces acidicola]|uniref:DNRLRE domain-containing protein n=1 Tax=Streptomyces acidicola TaxID=2596892 RepID=UPI00341F71CE